MHPIIAVLRAVLAAGLMAGLGFAGVVPCPSAELSATVLDSASHHPHDCACLAISGHCCCGSKCHCGNPSSQRGTLPVVPARGYELTQYFVVPLAGGVAGGSTAWPSTAHSPLACLADFGATLVAQGTRLNI